MVAKSSEFGIDNEHEFFDFCITKLTNKRNMRIHSETLFAIIGVAAICFSACDDDSKKKVVPTSLYHFENVKATSYTDWVYVNLHQKDTVTLGYQDVNYPAGWDFAIHRYDVKTNGGGAIETAYDDIAKFLSDVESGSFPQPLASSYAGDVQDSIIVDLSHMMAGKVVYAHTSLNTELGKWLNLDLSTMPPVYTSSGKVYLLMMKDETVAAIKFTGYSNPQLYNMKGYISFDYLYPINFVK